MKHHHTILGPILAAIVLSACGCAPDKPSPTSAASTPGSPTTATKALGPASIYKFPADLCAVVRLDPFIEVQPGTPKTDERRRTAGARSASSTCVATLGTHPDGLIVMTSLEIFTQTSTGQAQFEAIRGITLRDYPNSTDVSGVGDAAYFYTDPKVGPTLVVRHGTALIDVSVTRLGPGATLPADAQQRLTQLVQQTLTSVPRA